MRIQLAVVLSLVVAVVVPVASVYATGIPAASGTNFGITTLWTQSTAANPDGSAQVTGNTAFNAVWTTPTTPLKNFSITTKIVNFASDTSATNSFSGTCGIAGITCTGSGLVPASLRVLPGDQVEITGDIAVQTLPGNPWTQADPGCTINLFDATMLRCTVDSGLLVPFKPPTQPCPSDGNFRLTVNDAGNGNAQVIGTVTFATTTILNVVGGDVSVTNLGSTTPIPSQPMQFFTQTQGVRQVISSNIFKTGEGTVVATAKIVLQVDTAQTACSMSQTATGTILAPDNPPPPSCGIKCVGAPSVLPTKKR